MKTENIQIKNVPAIILGEPSDKVFLYVHGQGGCKEECQAWADIICEQGYQILAIDLPEHGARKEEKDTFNPWHAIPDLHTVLDYAKNHWSKISLLANSIGAWFSMLSFSEESLNQCFFISPILDMEHLILNMIQWAGTSEKNLAEKGTIPTTFGQTLSWNYLTYVREHPISHWDIHTYILYGDKDHLTERTVVEQFMQLHSCTLTILENGEHWFHTPAQIAYLRNWLTLELNKSILTNCLIP